MGRLLLFLLIVAAIFLLWKAFGPASLKNQPAKNAPPAIKGPDDDEEFLWNIDKQRFKERREREMREEAEKQQRELDERLRRQRDEKPDD